MSENQQSQGQQNPLSAFGFKPATTSPTTNTNQSSGFGAFLSTPSLFGGVNAAQSNATNTSQTTSTPAPLFIGGSGILGQNQNQNQSSTPSAGSLFGAVKSNPGSEQSSASAGSATSSGGSNPLFGATTTLQPSPFSAFGAKPSNTPTQPGSSTTGSSSSGPALPSLFGGSNAPAANATNATSTSSPSSGLFASLPKKPEVSLAPNPTSGSSPFSAFTGLGATKDANKEAAKDDKSGASASGGSLLGRLSGSADGSKDTTKTNPSTDTTSKVPLFGASVSGVSKPAEPDAIPASGASATTGKAATAAPSGSTPIPAPSTLRGKTVEDIVNQWTAELETHTREFSQFASEVAVWDRTLVENGHYISALYTTVLAAESTQASLDQSLDHVEQQQRQLTATLDQYEKSASEILHGPGGVMTSTEGLGLADSERDKSYALAANLYTQLDDLSRSLTQMVESVNTLQLKTGPSQGSGVEEEGSQDDPVSTIANILNAHLASLQWIDSSLREMDVKVKDAERKIKDTSVKSGSGRGRGYGLGSSRR